MLNFKQLQVFESISVLCWIFSARSRKQEMCVATMRITKHFAFKRRNKHNPIKRHRGHSSDSAPGADGDDVLLSQTYPGAQTATRKAEIGSGPLAGRYPKSSSRVKWLILKWDLES